MIIKLSLILYLFFWIFFNLKRIIKEKNFGLRGNQYIICVTTLMVFFFVSIILVCFLFFNNFEVTIKPKEFFLLILFSYLVLFAIKFQFVRFLLFVSYLNSQFFMYYVYGIRLYISRKSEKNKYILNIIFKYVFKILLLVLNLNIENQNFKINVFFFYSIIIFMFYTIDNFDIQKARNVLNYEYGDLELNSKYIDKLKNYKINLLFCNYEK